MEPIRLFLAGKIGPLGEMWHKRGSPRPPDPELDWRCGIVSNYQRASLQAEIDLIEAFKNNTTVSSWPILEYAILGRHHYVGPYAITPTGWDEVRDVVFFNCMQAILQADYVFAWIDDPTSHGTFVELGYAYAYSKYIWLASRDYIPEFWFAYHTAGGKPKIAETPKLALESYLREHEFIEETTSRLEMTESPIERMFYASSVGIVALEPQFIVGKYRIDFAIPDKRIAIELDGHDYHKTKEQRTNDAQRERYLQENGWTVIRFTGSEVYKDASGCVDQVLRILERLNGHTHEQHG
jgi:very-short-patch-repair endonuclease